MSSENHKMEIRPFAGHVRVMTAGYMIAETDNAVELREADYPTVYYIPKYSHGRIHPVSHFDGVSA